VNDRAQLVEAESLLFARIARHHSARGVTVRVGARIEDCVTFAGDALVGAYAHLRGATEVGAGAVIDVGCVVTDAQVGEGAVLGPYTIVRGAAVADGTQTAPHAVLGGPPGSDAA
jgi:bifunctional UDP-N-acetylglucosamine pyrophosphorylase/glucosamine-1-phosphate N-acetyltransferase